MKVEGIKDQGGKLIGKGEFKFKIKDNNLTVLVTGQPKPNKKIREDLMPMENVEMVFPLKGRNLKNLFKLITEGRDNLVKKANGERDDIGFDEKLSNKEEYIKIRGQSWAFTFLARSGNKEAYLVMKPREFYPFIYTIENYIANLPEYSAIITKDLDVLICTAKKGEGLSFRTVETDGDLGTLTDKATLTALYCDLEDRTRTSRMYPSRFGSITLTKKQGQLCLRAGGRYYKTDRQGLFTLKLLTKIAIG